MPYYCPPSNFPAANWPPPPRVLHTRVTFSESSQKNNRDLHIKTLDGIVGANALFTAAVFIGASGTVTPSPGIPKKCIPGDDITLDLFLFEMLSFGLFLLSSLLAQGMKLAITRLEAIDPSGEDGVYMVDLTDSDSAPPAADPEGQPMQQPLANRKPKKYRFFRPIMGLSAVCSVWGSFFLLLSMVDLIQIKLGLLSCGSLPAVVAFLLLIVLVVFGLSVYIFAVWKSLKEY